MKLSMKSLSVVLVAGMSLSNAAQANTTKASSIFDLLKQWVSPAQLAEANNGKRGVIANTSGKKGDPLNGTIQSTSGKKGDPAGRG